MYNVLKVCKLLKNRKKDGFIFKDKIGKIYFLAKVEKDIVVNLEIGKRYLVWVIKEEQTHGYCRTNIDGMLIRDHIDYLAKRNRKHYLTDVSISRDIVRFSNDMYNHDVQYNQPDLNTSVLPESVIDFESIKGFIEFIDRTGNQSKITEHKYKLVCLDAYLYNLLNVIRIKQ